MALSRKDGNLEQMDEVFQNQLKTGVIEKIENANQFRIEHPEFSFFPFMPIFKLERETTKCRIVFLSNICEKDPTKVATLSHNQTIHAGPSINQKLSSSILHLRVGSKICCLDLVKAFNQIALEEHDQNRLLFLWFNNLKVQDHNV